MSDETDPLDGADVGETRTVRETKTLHGINFEPMGTWSGDDRIRGNVSIVDVEVVESGPDDCDDLRVTWEGDVTKALPPRWDERREPVTEGEQRTERRRQWARKLARGAATVIPLGIAVAVGMHLTNAATQSMTVNGQPLGPVTVWDPVPILLVFVIVVWGLRGGLPGRVAA